MSLIVAISGGEIGLHETFLIDKLIVKKSQKTNPRLLFIPTASDDASGYIETIKTIYGSLGCIVHALLLMNESLSFEQIKHEIEHADIIYVGGGNTRKMMEIWQQKGVDRLLRDAFLSDKILAGLSAGAICWFKYGHSDSQMIEGISDAKHMFVEGLGFIPYIVCPHYEEAERASFDWMITHQSLPGLAMESKVALIYDGHQYELVRSVPTVKAYAFIAGQKCLLDVKTLV